MPKLLMGSLRSRILLLAALTCLLLAAAAVCFFAFLRTAHTAALSTAEHHLTNVATRLAQSYSSQEAAEVSLAAVFPAEPPHPPPPPFAGVHAPRPAPPQPPPPRADAALSGYTASVLQHESGIEGGFFAARSGILLGYAFPTHEGPGATKEMPQRERPTITTLVREAASSDAVRTFRFEGAHDAVLFVAAPVTESVVISGRTGAMSRVTGAVWLMERLPGINTGRSRDLILGSGGFLSAAMLTALLAFFVVREVRNGVQLVLGRLVSLEGGLHQPSMLHTHLEEFDRVLDGIDTLARSLQQKIESERRLEAQMRHNERLSALGQFAAGIAHELRNPLATLRLRTQMTQRAVDPQAVAKNSRVILEEIDRLDSIIGRLLYFARPAHPQMQPVALDELCAASVSTWSDRKLPGNITLACIAASGAVVSCDRSQMVQVLDNLIENAVHSVTTQPRGEVTLSTAQRGGFAEIEVRDNGRGFGADALQRALDPFFTTKETGTGLGLSISWELVHAHGGELHMADAESGGAIVRIRLPLEPDAFPTRRALAGDRGGEEKDNG